MPIWCLLFWLCWRCFVKNDLFTLLSKSFRAIYIVSVDNIWQMTPIDFIRQSAITGNTLKGKECYPWIYGLEGFLAGGMDNSLISIGCSFCIFRCLRLRFTICRCRSFSSSVRTRSSFIPISKHRRKRHDEHRRICKNRAVLAFSSRFALTKILRSRCRQGNSSS